MAESGSRRREPFEPGWEKYLAGEFEQQYMQDLSSALRRAKRRGEVIYPPGGLIFNALRQTPFAAVRVVILGQDPYHQPQQAHGLSFSVPPGVTIPPSLKNIFAELQSDLGCAVPHHGHLQSWAQTGVLLLNSVLTVRAGSPASHSGMGWERFTDTIVAALNRYRQGLVFMLWGSNAKNKGAQIDRHRHLVLETSHPSPLSVHRGFSGCRHFSQANNYLQQQGREPVDWCLAEAAE